MNRTSKFSYDWNKSSTISTNGEILKAISWGCELLQRVNKTVTWDDPPEENPKSVYYQ